MYSKEKKGTAMFPFSLYFCKMNSLFKSEPINLHLPDAAIIYYPTFFDKEEADSIYTELINEIPWQQDEIRVFGKTHPQPRLTALFGNEGKPYSYSNIKMHPHLWNLLLQKIKSKIESVTDTNFTTVLLNYYRDGKDSNGWHADNETEYRNKSCNCFGQFWCRTYVSIETQFR